jgi:sulfur-oxidizing protein SoxA
MRFLFGLLLIFLGLICDLAYADLTRQSGNAFLSPEMLKQQNDPSMNPLSLWVDQGQELYKANCQECHQSVGTIAKAVVQFPKWSASKSSQGQLINIEDQIASCYSKKTGKELVNDDTNILSLSIFLSDAARGLKIHIQEPTDSKVKEQWQSQMNLGAQIYTQRQGRLNLSCTQCHDQRIGKNLRSEIISPAYVTGFPIYRQSWQAIGSLDRRLRACYSGVQAKVPASASSELRALELFLKKRSESMLWDGPSLRR